MKAQEIDGGTQGRNQSRNRIHSQQRLQRGRVVGV